VVLGVLAEGGGESAGAVAGAVVGHHAGARDAVLGEELSPPSPLMPLPGEERSDGRGGRRCRGRAIQLRVSAYRVNGFWTVARTIGVVVVGLATNAAAVIAWLQSTDHG
jgi:hypothetical protein